MPTTTSCGPGLAVYGLSPMPADYPAARLGLRPAMTLTARVALAKRVPAGQGVSYLHKYTTDSETTLALVPLGYADGIPRAATNVGPVLVAGRRRSIAGTVCMDQFVIDVGDDPVAAGDDVVLFGPGDSGEPTADDWADVLEHDLLRDRHADRTAGRLGCTCREPRGVGRSRPRGPGCRGGGWLAR